MNFGLSSLMESARLFVWFCTTGKPWTGLKTREESARIFKQTDETILTVCRRILFVGMANL